MAWLIICGLFVVSVIIQGSVLALIGPFGTHPDILLVIVVALGLLGGMRNGAIVGLCAGLLQDILFGSPLGFFAAVKMLSGALAGVISDDIYKDVTLAPMFLVLFFTLFSDLVTFFLMKLFGISIPHTLFIYLTQYTLIRVLMHFFIMGIIYPYLYRAHRRQLLFINNNIGE